MQRVFTSFEEIREDVAKNAPPLVYKYRDWNDANHRTLLTDCRMWFPHPFDLDDPLEVRPETAFDVNELFDQRYFKKLLHESLKNRAEKGFTEEACIKEAEEQWEQTKADPGLIIQGQRDHNADRKNFDPYGIFSTAMGDRNERVWQEYGKEHSGFCMGFKTVSICEKIKGGYAGVHYSDEPLPFSFLDPEIKEKFMDLELRYKKLKWRHEDEFRFIMVGIGHYYDSRIQVFDPHVVEEITIGYNMPLASIEDILMIVKQKYPPGLPVFRTTRDTFGELQKERIQ